MNVNEAFARMAKSEFFLVAGTGAALQELRNKGDIYHHILMAEALRKPVILMLNGDLRPLERAEFLKALERVELIGTIYFNLDSSSDQAKKRLERLLASWRKKTGITSGQAAVRERSELCLKKF